MQIKKIIAVLGIGLLAVGVLAGCGSNTDKTEKKADVKKVKVAYAQNSKPINYTDENGKPAGHDVEIMKLVDGLLPQYEFEFIPTTDDDLLLGVEQGKYDVGIKNTFYTEARAKKYIYPKEFLGLSSFGLVLRTDDANIKTLADFAKAGKTLAPIAAITHNIQLLKNLTKKILITRLNWKPVMPLPLMLLNMSVKDALMAVQLLKDSMTKKYAVPMDLITA